MVIMSDCSKNNLNNSRCLGSNNIITPPTSANVVVAGNNNKKCNSSGFSAPAGSPIKVGLYDIGDVIGEGNFATVRFARHRHTKSDVSGIIIIIIMIIIIK